MRNKKKVYVVISTSNTGDFKYHPEGGVLRVTDNRKIAELVAQQEYDKLPTKEVTEEAKRFKWLRIIEKEVE